ncbi:VWA domain-containing protein [bacterium]|nr:VWA domain-containing protein [bacterium]
MFFLNPSFLIGLFSLSVPVMIHLIARRKRNRVVFSSLRFLRSSQRRVGRAFNIRQWILLALRVLILTTLVLSFSRPMTTGGWFASWLGGSGRNMIVLVDTSCSMAAVAGNETLFQRAQTAAVEMIRSIGPGSHVAVIAFDRQARTITPGWSADRNGAIDAVRSLQPTYERTNLSSALSLLPRLFENAPGPMREIVLLTDLQKAAWDHVPPGSLDEAKVKFLVVHCGEGRLPNAAFGQVEFSVKSTLSQAPVHVRASVHNYSQEEMTPTCSFYMSGQKVSEQRLYIPPQGAVMPEFEYTSTTRGQLTGYLALSADGLGRDNRFYFCTDLPKTIPVVIADPHAGQNEADSFYLSRALAPPGGRVTAIQPKIVKTLNKLHLQHTNTVMFTAAATIPDESWFFDWLKQGGQAIAFLGNAGMRENTLTADLHIRPQPSAVNEAVWLTQVDAIEDSVAQLLSDTPFYQTASLSADLTHPSISMLAWFADGRPAVARKRVGEGSLTILGIPAGRQGTDFPLQLTYLPFVHEILSLHMNRKSLAGTIGEPAMLLATHSQARITTPDDESIVYRSAQTPIPPASAIPGFYSAEVGKDKTLHWAANITPTESNPTQLKETVLRERIPPARVVPVQAILDRPASQLGISDWTDAMLLLCLLLIVVEYLVAGRFAVPINHHLHRGGKPTWTD